MEDSAGSRGDESTISASLSMSSGETSFAVANSWFERFLDEAKVPDYTRADLLVVFEEVVVNVVRHAYRGAVGTIEVTAEKTGETLTLTVRDDGPPFDLLAQPEPDLDLPVAERPLGGLGVYLVKCLCDGIRYQRRGESNILVMTKAIHGRTGRDAMSLEIRTEARGAARRVALSGRLDSDTSAQLEEVVTPWFDDTEVTHVLFDLRELKYVSSAGLRVFLLVQKALGDRNGSVVIAEMQPSVAKVFEIAKALPSVSIFRNVQELDDYLDYIQRKAAGELDE